MKKYTLVLTLFLSALIFVACASKKMSALEERIQKHIVFQDLDKDVLKDFNYKININTLLEVELVFLSQKDLQLSYKIAWKDEDGFSVKTFQDEEYTKIKLKANKEFILQRVASNKEVVDFKIFLSKE